MYLYIIIMYSPFYINIDHRTDRKECIEEEFKRLNIETYLRIPAIYIPENGAKGCLASHIKVLETASLNDEAIWVCEDDIEFKVDRDTLDAHIKEFMESDADILCLGYNSINEIEYSPLLYHTKDVQTTSCYIIKNKFRNILLEFWRSLYISIESGIEHDSKQIYVNLEIFKNLYETCDQSWKVLQQSYIFVIPKIRCVIQRSSYSDIENRIVDYGM